MYSKIVLGFKLNSIDYIKKYVQVSNSSDIILFDDATLINFKEHLLLILEGLSSAGLNFKWHTPILII